MVLVFLIVSILIFGGQFIFYFDDLCFGNIFTVKCVFRNVKFF